MCVVYFAVGRVFVVLFDVLVTAYEIDELRDIYICLTYKLNRHKNLDVVKHRSLILRWLEAAHIIIPDHPLFRYYFIHTNSIAILLTL